MNSIQTIQKERRLYFLKALLKKYRFLMVFCLGVLAIPFNSEAGSPGMVNTTVILEGDTDVVELKVWGTAACKVTIENIIKQNPLVIMAEFNAQENIVQMTYLMNGFDKAAVVTALVNAGYDAEAMRAGDEVYDALGNECKYVRPTY